MRISNLLILIILIFQISCSKKSEIKPFVQAQFDRFIGIDFSYPIEEEEVDDPTGDIPTSKIPLFGLVFQEIARGIGVIFIGSGLLNNSYDLPPIEIDYPELAELDFSYIKSVELKKVFLKAYPKKRSFEFLDTLALNRLSDLSTFEKSKQKSIINRLSKVSNNIVNGTEPNEKGILSFVDNIEVFLLAIGQEGGIYDFGGKDSVNDPLDPSKLRRILYYSSSTQQTSCRGSCINFLVDKNIEWEKVLEKNTRFKIFIKFKFNKSPTHDLAIGGNVDFKVTVDTKLDPKQ